MVTLQKPVNCIFKKWSSSEWLDVYHRKDNPQHHAISEFDCTDSDMHSFTGGAAGNTLSVAAAGVKDGQEVPLDIVVDA